MLTLFIARRLPSGAGQTPVVPADAGHREGFFGERVASVYDERAADLFRQAGGEAIDVAIGDLATTRVEGEFSLVYLMFNTIFNLVTQDECLGPALV
jgi:hypothetical protein